MRKISILFLVFLVSLGFSVMAQKGYINPAAKYCEMLGYKHEVINDKDGSQGVVHLPNGEIVDAWSFFKGKVGQEFSYAAKYGYQIETQKITRDGFVEELAVCVKTNELGQTERIPLLDLMEQNGEPLEAWVKMEAPSPMEYAKVDENFNVMDALPTAFDWRSNNGHSYIGAVRNQGSCGSCYSFGAAAAAEGAYNLAMNKVDGNTADFSEAYIAWCLSTISPYSSHFSGCNGADYDYYELQALCDIGIINESYFPYVDQDNQSCPSSTSSAPKTVFENWYRVACADENAIKTAIMTYGVVDAAVYVSTAFQNYSGGIYTDNTNTCSTNPCYNTPTNHAISLVGWGTDATYGTYWILRNSWGSSWGENGYMRIDANAAHVDCSVCYMVYQNSGTTTPTVATGTISNIQDYMATCGGSITDDGGATITASGLVYSTTANPTTSTGTVVETSPTITSGAFSLSMTGLQSGTTYYVRAFASNTNGTAYGSQVSFTTTGEAPITYCTSKGNNSSYEWITKVQIGSFTNSSGAAGYTDFTGTTVALNSGQAYSITLTPAFSGSTYNEYWKIWVDLNKDGDFDDANENVFDAGTMSKTAVTGTLTIPSGTSPVVTRMRVSMKYNGAQTACESFSYGEVEDYTVQISGGDTQAPTAPGSLASSNITASSVNLSWTASSDNVGVTGYDVYRNGVLLASTASTSYSVTGLSSNTTYQFYVKAKDAAGNVSAASNTISVTTLFIDTQAPTAPSNLTASNITTNSATLAWTASTDNVGVTGYDVYKNSVLVASTTTTSYNATELTANTTYQFYVKAKDAAGNVSAASSTLAVTTENSGTTCYQSEITLVLVLDNYPAETSWDIKDASNAIVASGNGYTTKNATVTESFNLDGDFTFTIYDTYGDGICCSYGNGSYTLTDANNQTIATGGSFGKSESKAFCAEGGSTPVTYCASQGNNASYEWIAKVQVGTFTNSSASAKYTDFTAQTINAVTGNNSITLTPGFASSTYNEYWKVWVDFNVDGDFDDAGELAYDAGALSKTAVSGNLVVPTSAAGITTRMRVSMKYNGAQTSCEAFSYGEVEDYTISITNRSFAFNSGSNDLQSEYSFNLYPNPVNDILIVETSEFPIELKIFNAMGKMVNTKQISENKSVIHVADYPAGLYTVSVIYKDEIKTFKFIKR